MTRKRVQCKKRWKRLQRDKERNTDILIKLLPTVNSNQFASLSFSSSSSVRLLLLGLFIF
jgi:hypothetical protein